MTLFELYSMADRLMRQGTPPDAEVFVYERVDGPEPSVTGTVTEIQQYGSVVNILFDKEDF